MIDNVAIYAIECVLQQVRHFNQIPWTKQGTNLISFPSKSCLTCLANNLVLILFWQIMTVNLGWYASPKCGNTSLSWGTSNSETFRISPSPTPSRNRTIRSGRVWLTWNITTKEILWQYHCRIWEDMSKTLVIELWPFICKNYLMVLAKCCYEAHLQSIHELLPWELMSHPRIPSSALLIHRSNESANTVGTTFVEGVNSTYHKSFLKKKPKVLVMKLVYSKFMWWSDTPFVACTDHCSMPSLLANGMLTPQSSPPSLQLICKTIFCTTLRKLLGLPMVLLMITCEGTGDSTQHSFLIAL